jgi:hypothetical protein
MSKYRCPRCGATHKDPVAHCRLCGMDMTGEHQPVGAERRTTSGKRSGVASIAVFGVLGVLAIAALAVALGLGGDDSGVDQLTDQIPGVRAETSDGWVPLEEPEGGFVVSLPGTATQTTVDFPPAVNGQATVWTATIADEIRMTVGWADLPPLPEGSSDAARLEQLADDWASAHGTSVRDLEQSDFSGLEAVDTTLRDTDLEGESANAKAFLFMRGDRMYVVMVESIYVDMPQYIRVLTSLSLI